MKNIILKARKRKILGKKTKKLKKQNQLPAILYGHKVKNIPLTIDKKEFDYIFHQAGQTTLINLEITDIGSKKVLIQEVQLDPVSGHIIHIDFHQVKLTQKIKTEVPIITKGMAPAVSDLEGSLIINKDKIEIECLPQDLIHEIKIDVSELKTFDDKILIEDLKVPENIKILDDLEEVVALVNPPRSEEELAELEEAVEEKVEEVEIEKEAEKEEGEEEATEKTTKSTQETKSEETNKPEEKKTPEK